MNIAVATSEACAVQSELSWGASLLSSCPSLQLLGGISANEAPEWIKTFLVLLSRNTINPTFIKAQVFPNTTFTSPYAKTVAKSDVVLPANVSFGTISLTGDTAEAFNVFDACVYGFQNVESISAPDAPNLSPVPLIKAYWEPGATETKFFPSTNTLLLLGLTTDDDGYDDDVILHEFGHFVSRNWSKVEDVGGTHVWNSLIDARQAWKEGFSHYFSSVTRRYANSQKLGQPGPPSPYFDVWWQVDTKGTSPPSPVFEIETPSGGTATTTAENETAVAAGLWDITDISDPTKEPFDTLPTATADHKQTWWVLRWVQGPPAAIQVSLEDFFQGWITRFDGVDKPEVIALSGDRTTTKILNQREIRYFADRHEPNDTHAAATALRLGLVSEIQTFYKAAPSWPVGEADWFKVALSGTGRLTAETLTLQDGADTLLEIYDSAGIQLGSNDDRAAGDRSSRAVVSISAAGTYFIRVVASTDTAKTPPAFMEFGKYDLKATFP